MEVQVIDGTHQEFNGKIYTKRVERGDYYFCNKRRLHREVWKFHNGEIPKGCEIHHTDLNKDNNALTNLQCLTKSEHMKLHRALAGNPPPTNTKVLDTCIYCGETFFTNRRKDQNHLCSKECRSAYQYRNNLVTRTCAYCGKEFSVNKHVPNLYCSRECAQRNRYKDCHVKKICPTCGKEFETGRVADRKYCSLPCYKNRPRGF